MNPNYVKLFPGIPLKPKLQNTTLQEVAASHNHLAVGGSWKPHSIAEPPQKVALIIPYRDRPLHLAILMNNLHDFLQKQNVHYQVFVVEQVLHNSNVCSL